LYKNEQWNLLLNILMFSTLKPGTTYTCRVCISIWLYTAQSFFTSKTKHGHFI